MAGVLALLAVSVVWIALVVPIPCLPPSCGPPGAEPLAAWQILLAYLPYTWPLLLAWLALLVRWAVRRARARR